MSAYWLCNCRHPNTKVYYADEIDVQDKLRLEAVTENKLLKETLDAMLTRHRETGYHLIEALEKNFELKKQLSEAIDLFCDPELITEIYGPRCKTFNQGCPCCRAWKLFDENKP